jgi:hypothetical protein
MRKHLDWAPEICKPYANSQFRKEFRVARALHGLCAANAALRLGYPRCNGFASLRKMWPTSATRISAARTFSRSFPGSSHGGNGSSSLPLASLSAGPACPPADPRTRQGARYLAAAISIAAFSAIYVCVARAWTGILLLFVKKTDSAEWLEILLPWSWNPLQGGRHRFTEGSPSLRQAKYAFTRAALGQFQTELARPIWSKRGNLRGA